MRFPLFPKQGEGNFLTKEREKGGGSSAMGSMGFWKGREGVLTKGGDGEREEGKERRGILTNWGILEQRKWAEEDEGMGRGGAGKEGVNEHSVSSWGGGRCVG